jgi:hypothetical protein
MTIYVILYRKATENNTFECEMIESYKSYERAYSVCKQYNEEEPHSHNEYFIESINLY